MYSSFVSRRLLPSRNRVQELFSTRATRTNRIAPSAFQTSQRVSVSSTTPVDDADAPWNAIEGPYTEVGGEWDGCRRDFMAPIQIGVRGPDILHNPFFNKGTAFKTEERDRLRFRGLLPARFNNIKMQMERFLVSLRATKSDIHKNIQLEDLHDLNETLYHRILVDHIEGAKDVLRLNCCDILGGNNYQYVNSNAFEVCLTSHFLSLQSSFTNLSTYS